MNTDYANGYSMGERDAHMGTIVPAWKLAGYPRDYVAGYHDATPEG